MHICLLPIEILIDIFADIYEADFRLGSRPTLAALARTCRRFKEPALDALWKDMDGFMPLILCLPEDVRGNTAIGGGTPARGSTAIRGAKAAKGKSRIQWTLKRPLFPGEWKIFNSYACRIRSLVIYDRHLNQIDDRVVQTLISALPLTLLPNLDCLQWENDQDSYLPLLQALLAPTLRSITLCSIQSKWGSSFAKSALLVSLGGRCPHIQKFVCSYSSDFDEHSELLCETVCCWSELVLLKTGVLNTRALAHLASLPSLKSLHFESCGVFSGMHPNSFPTFASELDGTFIGAPSLPILIRCLRNVRFISCRLVVLSLHDLDLVLSDPLDIPEFIFCISECFSSTLERLSVQFAGLGSISTERLNDPRFMLSFHAVTPLLSFNHLKKVDLSCFCASAIDDAMIKTMAQSWPLLEEFSIGGGACWLIPPSLTFTGLVHLIRHCQHLWNITMPFRASLIDINSEPFSKTIPNAEITYIYVGNSPIDAAITAAVACQLHVLLPNLMEVICFPPWYDTVPPVELQPSEAEWRRVEEFLKVLTKAAKMKQKQEQVLQEYSLLA